MCQGLIKVYDNDYVMRVLDKSSSGKKEVSSNYKIWAHREWFYVYKHELYRDRQHGDNRGDMGVSDKVLFLGQYIAKM